MQSALHPENPGAVVVQSAAQEDGDNLDEPLCLCHWAALIEGIRVVSEKAEEMGINLTELDADALAHYVRTKSNRLLQVNFPEWQRESVLPNTEEKIEVIPPRKKRVMRKVSEALDEARIRIAEEIVLHKDFGKLPDLPPCGPDDFGRPLTEKDLEGFTPDEFAQIEQEFQLDASPNTDATITPEAPASERCPGKPHGRHRFGHQSTCKDCGREYMAIHWAKIAAKKNKPEADPAITLETTEPIEALPETQTEGEFKVPERGWDGRGFYNPERVMEARRLFLAGCSVREVAAQIGMSKATVVAIRKTIPELPNCECGRPLGHRGWCRERYAKSTKRQEFMHRWRTGRESKQTRDLIECGVSKIVPTSGEWEHYFHDQAKIAGREWTCSMCMKKIQKGMPYMHTECADEDGEMILLTCWKCAEREEITPEFDTGMKRAH